MSVRGQSAATSDQRPGGLRTSVLYSHPARARGRTVHVRTAELRLYSRVVQCEIRKSEVYDIDFSRPSPKSKYGLVIHSNYRFGSDYMSPFREIALLPPQSQNYPSADIARKRRSTERPGYRPTRVLHATVPSGSGPARKHTAKFEPAAWSWAQMTSGSGAPKRDLSEKAITFKLQRPN